ncbi:hypothetical protein Hamer_G011755 [Homarus americanus]|uniref:C2H2-type domain-containing protein n=1 Tax=Homarus americanus TaxID=6706 RepID=A0A8J5K276_HOMAM|nr:hypothetical protein Hamer_G011755 [Homarus americanus]
MSYLPPWAPTSGGGHYPPHMLSPHTTTTSPHSPHTSHSTTQPNTSGSVYQNLSPVVKSISPASVSVTQSNNTPKSSTVPSTGSSSSPTSVPTSAPSSASSISIGDQYEPQGFKRPYTPPPKRPDLGDGLKTENTSMGDSPPPEMLLALAGPSSLDLKSPRKYVRRSPGKYPAPEQLASPVMFSYQGRGRPRKNWTHSTGLPTMIPVTHPPMHPVSVDDPDDEENKPFKCNICKKGFKLKGGLMQHERTHSTDRPYCHKDVTDPRIVLQQAKRMIKEEQNDDVRLGNQGREHDGSDRRIGQERVDQDREMGENRGLGQDGMGQNRIGQERGMGQDVINQDRSHGQDHRESVGSNSEQGGYQGNGEQVRHEHRSFPLQSASNNSSTHKSPHSLPMHSNTDQQRENSSAPPHSQPPSISPNMMPTPQMAMTNLIPYPHSIFPATSYMMPPPDPRQYHPQNQGQHPSRPNQ